MAELRSTDIIDKLSKLKKQIDELQTAGISKDALKDIDVPFTIELNGKSYKVENKDGVIKLDNIIGLTDSEKQILSLLGYDFDAGEYSLELNNTNLVIPQGRAIYTPDLYIGGEQSGAFTRYEKTKLNNIEDGAQKNPGLVTTSADGLMGFSDKQKLDNIQSNANYYTIEIIDLRSNG